MLVKSYLDPCINIYRDFRELIVVLKRNGSYYTRLYFHFLHLEEYYENLYATTVDSTKSFIWI